MTCRSDSRVYDIKQAVSITRAFEYYGYPVKRGFVCCPFHSERTASLKIYEDTQSFYCFGCGVSGDVIDFVRLLYHLTFPQALARLESDFGITSHGGTYVREPTERERYQAKYKALTGRWKEVNEIIRNKKPRGIDEPPCVEFTAALKEKTHLDEQMKELEEKWRR